MDVYEDAGEALLDESRDQSDQARQQTEHARAQTAEARFQSRQATIQTRLFLTSVILGGASLLISLIALLRI